MLSSNWGQLGMSTPTRSPGEPKPLQSPGQAVTAGVGPAIGDDIVAPNECGPIWITLRGIS